MPRKRTISERLCDALVRRGHRETTTRARKVRVFERTPGGDIYIVGKGGGFRVGRTVSDSHSLQGTLLHRDLLREVPE